MSGNEECINNLSLVDWDCDRCAGVVVDNDMEARENSEKLRTDTKLKMNKYGVRNQNPHPNEIFSLAYDFWVLVVRVVSKKY